MTSKIKSVAVLGSGTMGSGIAALAAEKNCKVLLLDVTKEQALKGKTNLISGKNPSLSDDSKIDNIEVGSFNEDFEKIINYDWICEVVIEDIQIKKEIFNKIDKFRSDNSIVSSNTSGIPLRDITKDINSDLLKNVCITHFFNPVKIMKLCELIPGEKTSLETIDTIKAFLENVFKKGVVNGKDTVNFIGNRIGCFFILKGLHECTNARKEGMNTEKIDALLSKPMGLPPTGLYGLVDLIGLDVMHSVGLNLATNLPEDDFGRGYVKLPEAEQDMFNSGKLGRKTGGGFYRLNITNDNKIKEVYDIDTKIWREAEKNTFDEEISIIFEDTLEGKLAWNIMGSTICYAANLIPEIADDILNVDRAMRWGFAWSKGPFELMDMAGNSKFFDKCIKENIEIPKMLKLLKTSGKKSFYIKEENKYFSISGDYENI